MRPRFWIPIVLALLVSCAHRPAINLSESDAGKTITIAPGETLVIRLASNPTTGYAWTLVKAPEHLELVGGAPVYEPPDGALPGAGGHQSFRLRANTIGRETVELRYARAWERVAASGPPYQVTIEIR